MEYRAVIDDQDQRDEVAQSQLCTDIVKAFGIHDFPPAIRDLTCADAIT